MFRVRRLRDFLFPPATIFVVALLLRLAVLHSHTRHLQSDEVDYDALGWSIVTTGSYSVDGHATAYRAPGYPFLVAGVYAVCGRNPSAVRHVQAVMDSITAVLLYVLMRRNKYRLAKRAAWIWALYPPAILFSNQLFSETFFVFLFVGFVFLLVARAEMGKPPSWMPGLLLGAAVLVKPTTLLVIVLLPLVTRNLLSPGVTTVVVLCGLLPAGLWAVRNALIVGAPVLSTSTGANLLIGNGPNANGGYTALNPSPQSTAGGEVDADRSASETAIGLIVANPIRAAGLGVKKVALLLSSEAELVVGFWSRPDENLRFRDRYQRVPIWAHLLVSLPYALLMLLGLVGFVSQEWDLLRSIFVALSGSILAATVIFFGGSRFHLPLMPFMAMFTAQYLESPIESMTSMGRTKRGLVFVGAGLLLALWIAEVIVMTR